MESIAEGMSGLQERVRLGEPRNIYYYDSRTTAKQSIPTIVDNRFLQALNQLGQGSSTFIISVDEGISDILFSATLPNQGVGSNNPQYANLGLTGGWLYYAINRISIRYASSSQYFWTGSQCLIENLREMPNPTCRDQLFQLGGAPMIGVASPGVQGVSYFANDADQMTAYAYLNFPHNSPNGSLDKPNPFPSELCGQPIVITLELNYLPSLFSFAGGASTANAPQTFASAYFQVKQVHAKDRGDLMARTGDMSRAYSFPTKAFYQNQIDIPLGKKTMVDGVPQNVLLTGFRAGQVRSIICWVTRDQDTSQSISVPSVKNFASYYRPRDVELLYNGTVYYTAQKNASEFWNLVSTETPSQLLQTQISLTGTAPNQTLQAGELVPMKWVEIPFSQVYEQLSGAHMYVEGKLIQNAVVNMKLTIDADEDDGADDTYTLHAVYAYNCTMLVAGGDVSYVF